MYCYILTYWHYEDSMLLPVFHQNRYSRSEFEKICKKAKQKAKKTNPYTGNEESRIYDIYNVLIDEFGFQSLNDKVFCFNVNDSKVTYLKDDSELDILLNYTYI